MTIIDTLLDTKRYAQVTMYQSKTVVLRNRTLLVTQVWFGYNVTPATFRCEAGAYNPYVVTRRRGNERATLIVPPHGPRIVSLHIDPGIINQLKRHRYRHFIDDSDWT